MKKIKTNNILMMIVATYLLIPLVLTFVYSLFTEWTSLLPTGFTLKFYIEVFSDALFWESLVRSVLMAVIPPIITAGMLLLVMYVVILYFPKLDRYINILCTIPYAIQGVILPISVLSLYSGAPGIFSNRIVLLISTYCVVILPYMYQGIKNSLVGVDAKRIIEAAQMLGSSKFRAFFAIVVPCVAPSIMISSLIAVAIVFGDFVIVNTIAGNYYQTAQVYLYRKMSSSGQLTSAIIVIVYIVTLLISVLSYKRQKKERN